MATLIEVHDYGNRLFYTANAEKGARVPPPVIIPRPNQIVEEQRPAVPADLTEMFGDSIQFDGANE